MRKFGKESAAPAETGGSRDKSDKGWLKSHWCALSLCAIVLVAFLLRTVFAYGVSADGDFALSGGSSAQYHLHVVESILNGSFAFTDAAVNYPFDGLNVFPPLLDFLAAGVASVLSMFGLETATAASAALAGINPVIGALTCIPVFLVGKELYDRRVGVVAALVFALLMLPISTSVFSNGTEYALAAFLVAFMSYFLIRMVKALDAEEVSKKSVLVNALVAGLFLALAALTWNGFRILIVLLVAAMVIQILVDRFRGRDFTTALVAYSVAIFVGVLLCAPYYMTAGLWDAVFSGLFLIAVIAVVLGFVFKAVQSKPWVVTIPALVVVFAAILVALFFAAPDLFTAVVSGNSIYSNSIMQALVSTRVSMSNVAAYYGWLTMWLPICVGIYELYVYAKRDRSATQLFRFVWLLVLFFCVWTSYANAAVIGVVFAVGSAAAIVKVLTYADLKSWFNTMKVAGFPGFLRKMIKPLPFASVLIVALLVVAPNVTFAVDAGMPNNNYDSSFNGNTQFTIKTGDSYPIGGVWDDYKDVPKDGALVTWIDYSYDAVSQGGFDTVTDTIGGGASAAANIYLAEGSAGATAAMMLRIVLSDPDKYLSMMDKTVADFINDPELAKAEIRENPSEYGNVRSDITDENAVYLACLNYFANNVSEGKIMDLYDRVCAVEGKKIGYVLADGSMLPLQYNDGDNFSTIAYFANYSTDSYGAAKQFFSYNTYYGTTVYTDAIYETFLWKAMIGPSAADAGYTSSYNYLVALATSDGKPGSAMAVPGAGLNGYEVAYWQVQYNDNNRATVGDSGWEYMDAYEAISKQRSEGGLINYLSSIVLLEYVGGNAAGSISGTVTDADGKAMSGAELTIYAYNDAFGRDVPVSSAKVINGEFTVTVPQGDYTAVVTMGNVIVASYSNSIPANVQAAPTTVSGSITAGQKVIESGYTLSLENTVSGEKIDVEVVNGTFSASVAPGTYTYSLNDSTAAAVSTGTINVSPGDNSGIALSPKTYTITVTVKDVFGELVEDGTVVATNSDTGAQFTQTIEDGKAVITAVPGSYTVTLADGKAAISPSTSNITSGNRTVTLTAYDADTVTVSGANGANLLAYAGNFSTITTNGGTQIDIPTGMATDAQLLTIYGISGKDAYIGVYNGSGSVSLTSGSNVVTGTIKDGDKGVAGTIRFINDNGASVNVVADSDGKFTAVLPFTGNCTIYANNGDNKVYFTQKAVSGDLGEIKLVDGRKITTTLTANTQISGSTSLKMAFVKAIINFEYDGKSYELFSMTGSDGSATFYIPDDVKSTMSFNDKDGKLSNDAFDCTNLKRDIDAGTSSNSNTITIKVKSGDSDKNVIRDVSVTAQYDMKMTLYDDDEKVYEFKAGETKAVPVGQYDVVINGSTGAYYDGTGYVYPGSNGLSGVEVVKVFTVNVDKANEDVVTISSEGKYFVDKGTYYFEQGYEFFLKSVNGTGDEQKIKYGYIDATGGDAANQKVDMTASDKKSTVTGYIGVAGDGELIVRYGDVKVVFDITQGAYAAILPGSVKSAEFGVKVTKTISGDEYEFAVTETLSNIEDKLVRNMAAMSNGVVEDEDSDFDVSIDGANLSNGEATVNVKVENNTDAKATYTITSGSAWYLKQTYTVTVDAKSAQTVTVQGYYDDRYVAAGSEGFSVTVTQVNGKATATCDITDASETGTGSEGVDIMFAKDGGFAFKDKVSAFEYMYAITVVNKDSTSKDVVINCSGVSGYTIVIQDEDGKLIQEQGTTFKVYGYQTTVFYVKVMPVVGSEDSKTVPSVSGSVKVGSTTESFNLNPEKAEFQMDSIGASGDDIYNEKAGIPSGIWFLLAVGVLLLIAVFWLGSKRGVFSRRN